MTKHAEKKYDRDNCRRYTVLKLEFIIKSVPQKPTFIALMFLFSDIIFTYSIIYNIQFAIVGNKGLNPNI